MTNRENILRGLRRQEPERVGFEFRLSPALRGEFKRRTGREDYQEYYQFPVRHLELKPTRLTTDFSRFFDTLPPGTRPLNWNPEWGVMGAPGAGGESRNRHALPKDATIRDTAPQLTLSGVAHFQQMLHPMEQFTSVAQLASYPWPDLLADYRWEGAAQAVQAIKDRDQVCAASMEMTIFEMAWYLRGMDRFLEDLLGGEALALELIAHLTEMRVGMARRYAAAGVDLLMLGDDVATQLDMMLSPDLWRQTIKPHLARIIRAAKDVRLEVLIFYHGDGNMQRILPDLIEIGVEVLNPVQPECMDPAALKERYGGQLAFWGCVGTQTTMPFGSPQEVKNTVRRLTRTVGKGGGLFLAPTHVLEPDVPWANVEAFVEAVGTQ